MSIDVRQSIGLKRMELEQLRAMQAGRRHPDATVARMIRRAERELAEEEAAQAYLGQRWARYAREQMD